MALEDHAAVSGTGRFWFYRCRRPVSGRFVAILANFGVEVCWAYRAPGHSGLPEISRVSQIVRAEELNETVQAARLEPRPGPAAI